MSFKIADAFVEVATRVAAGTNAKSEAAGESAGRSFDQGFKRGADGKLRDSEGKFVAEGKKAGKAFSLGFGDGFDLNKVGQNLRDAKEIWSSTIGPIGDFGKAIGGAAVKAGALSTALVGATGLAGGLVTFVSNVGAATQAAPLFALAYGQARVVALGFKVALTGVSDALKDSIGDAFTKVSPQAQHFVDTFKTIVPELVKAKNAVQDSAFDGLSDSIKPLAQTYLPMLEASGVAVADVFNGALKDAITSLRTASAKTNVQTILDGIFESVHDLIPPLSRVPSLLVKAGAQATPALNNITKQIGGLITSATDAFSNYLASGKLTGDIEKGWSVLVSLGQTIISVLGTVRGLARAAGVAFGDVLSPVKAVAQAISTYVNSAQGQAKITQIFRDAKPILAGIAQTFKTIMGVVGPLWPIILKLADAFLKALQPVIPIFGELAGQIGNILADVLPAVSDLAVALGRSLSSALKTLAPVIKPVADALTNLLGPTGAFQAFLKAIAPILPPLADALGKIANTIGQALAQAFNDLAPVLPGLVDAFSKLAVDLVEALAPILPDIAKAFADLAPVIGAIAKVADLFAIGLGKIIDWLGPLAPMIIAVTVAVWALNAALAVNPFVAIGIALVVLVGLVVKYWDQITGAIGAALTWIKDNVAKAWDWVYQHTIGWLINMAKGIGSWFANMGQVVATAVSGMAKTIGGLAGKAVSATISFGSALVSRGGDLIRGIGHGISVAWNDVVSWLKGIPGRIIGAVGNLGSILFDAGKRVISGFMDGIKSAWSASTGFFSKIAGDIVSLKGPPPKDSVLLVDNGRRIMSGLISGIESQRQALRDTLTSITGEIGDTPTGALGASRRGGVGSSTGVGAAFHVGSMTVTIPAKDLAEMKSVTDFFARVQQEARRQAPRMATT